MKKRLLIGQIIGFLGICIFAMGISYIITFYFDESLYENANLLVTFEDEKTFTLSNTKLLTKEEALKTYPYIFDVKNKGGMVSYSLKLKEKSSNLERENLNYILYLNDKEVKNGSLESLKEDVLYTTKIKKHKTDTYKLYIYVNKDLEDVSYKYSIEILSK